MVTVFKRFSFDAAHRLPGLADGHRCGRIHGHTFHLEVRCSGPVNPRTGMVVAYEDIKAAVLPVLADLDHHLLNELPALEIPTTENLAAYLWRRLQPALPSLSEIRLQETATAGVIYRGPVNTALTVSTSAKSSAPRNVMGIYGEGLGGKPHLRNYNFTDKVTAIDPKITGDAKTPLPVLPEAWSKFWRHGEWNELRVRIVGGDKPTITTRINGVKFMEWTETEARHPAKGAIALQGHGGGKPEEYTGKYVRYRAIRVKKLDGTAK